MKTSHEALNELKKGNQRFVSKQMRTQNSYQYDASLIEKQTPYAVILTCSDSRVAPETIFDCGLGEVFVIRVAGNVIDEVVLESIRYGVHALQANLVVVLGHTHCGAVQAACHHQIGDTSHAFVQTIVDAIYPSAVKCNYDANQTEVEHVRAMVQVLNKEPLLNDANIIGARYDIASGVVSFFENHD